MEDEFYSQTLRVDPALLRGEPTPAEKLGHYLVRISGAETGKRTQIGDAGMTIGRGPDQTLVVLDTSVSRRHARVSIVNGHVVAKKTDDRMPDQNQVLEAVRHEYASA